MDEKEIKVVFSSKRYFEVETNLDISFPRELRAD
jgi:hypothetical protein